VLGGTVSTGAFTAGALDFLTQALEAWHAQPAPPHRVLLRGAAGSSGGAVCAALLGLLSSRVVPHIQDSYPNLLATDPDQPTGNPLFDLWVNTFRMERLLDTADIVAGNNVDAGINLPGITAQRVAALVNTQSIDAAGQWLAAIGASPWQALPYFAQPFRVAVTVANLRGLPFPIADIPAIGAYTGAAYVQHDDFAWFAFPNGADPAAHKRPDEFWLGPGGPADGFADYATLVQWATASGSMPIGLVARSLVRPTRHYAYRPVVRAIEEPPGYCVDWHEPDWTALPDAAGGSYGFTAVDGGTFNNDPVSLLHCYMAGLIGHNPRGKSDATRAILMIDPLADQPSAIPSTGRSLWAVAQELVPAVIAASRYLTADIALFASENVFSRFQLVPARPEPGRVGSKALAGANLFAAAGWCARAFRVHDYLLGRANMQAYLRSEFVLSGKNPLFDGWSPDLRKDYAMDAAGSRISGSALPDPENYFLPILPDLTGVGLLSTPPWPVGAYNPASLQAPLQRRLDAVIGGLLADNASGGVLPWLGNLLLAPGLSRFVTEGVVNGFEKQLRSAGLWPPPAGAPLGAVPPLTGGGMP